MSIVKQRQHFLSFDGASRGVLRGYILQVTTRDRFVDSDGVRLRLLDRGPVHGPTVVLLHGWPDSSHLWRHQIPALADAGFRVLAPDQRGFGASDAPEGVGAYRMSTLIEDLRCILDDSDVQRVHLVGHDWGAALSWTVGRHLPELLTSLTVLSVGHPDAYRASGMRQRQLSWYMLLFLHEGLAERWLSDDDFSGLRAFAGDGGDSDRWMEDLSRPGRLTASLNWYRANMPAEALVLPPEGGTPVPVDTMGIWSTQDVALTEAQMTGSDTHVSGRWRYERIEGASHWIPVDRPDELTGLLLDWLR